MVADRLGYSFECQHLSGCVVDSLQELMSGVAMHHSVQPAPWLQKRHHLHSTAADTETQLSWTHTASER